MVIYAAFGWRLIAYLVDGAVIAVLQTGLYAGAILGPAHGEPKAMAVSVAVSSAATWAYFAVLESSPLQATLGKLAVGIRVEHVNGGPLTFRRASLRYWAKTLSSLTLMIGWLMAAFTPRRQALHDSIARSVVVKVQPAIAQPIAKSHWDPAVPLLAEYWDGRQWVNRRPTGGV
jgi:uncharacterized RDD family membrane protein YckC